MLAEQGERPDRHLGVQEGGCGEGLLEGRGITWEAENAHLGARPASLVAQGPWGCWAGEEPVPSSRAFPCKQRAGPSPSSGGPASPLSPPSSQKSRPFVHAWWPLS